jgi:spore germination protein KC
MNNVEIRPDCSVLVSRCNAEYFLKNSKPTLEKLSARYYEIAPTSSQYTGYTQSITLNDFFSDYTDTFKNCYAILGGINTQDTQNSDSTKSAEEQDSTNMANESLIQGDNNIENMGLAVFNGDKLVGELNGLETICHQIISNSLNSCIISIPDPFDTNKTISFKISLLKNTKNRVSLINNSAYITSNIKLEARILTMEENSNYLNADEIEQLENSLNSYLTTKVYNYLYKTSKEFKSDIDGFGSYVVQNFTTYDKWKNFNWLDKYENSFFNVTIDTTIKSGYILTKSIS